MLTVTFANDQPISRQAAYDKWLEAEVQEALDDPAPTIAHDEAMRQVRAAISALSR
jgi:hypothetical protein